MVAITSLRLGWRDVAHAGLAFVGSVIVTMPFTRTSFAQAGACAAGSVGYLLGLSAFRCLWLRTLDRPYQPNACTVPLTPRVLVEYVPPERLIISGVVLENSTIEQHHPGEPARYGFTVYLTEAHIRGIQISETMRFQNCNAEG